MSLLLHLSSDRPQGHAAELTLVNKTASSRGSAAVRARAIFDRCQWRGRKLTRPDDLLSLASETATKIKADSRAVPRFVMPVSSSLVVIVRPPAAHPCGRCLIRPRGSRLT